MPARAGRGRLLLAVVPAHGVRGPARTTHATLSGDRLTDVEFDAVQVDPAAVFAGGAPGDRRGVDAMDAAQDLGTLAVAAELVGMSARLLAMAVDRVKVPAGVRRAARRVAKRAAAVGGPVPELRRGT